MAKIEPAVTQLLYIVPDGTSYIDLAKDLSKVNRRLYRQGMTYVIQDVQLAQTVGLESTDITQVTMSTAGNSWIVHNAWKKGFSAWRDQVREITSVTGIKPGKWNDFKVYLDDSMEDGTILEPYAGDGAVYEAGEWIHSKLVFDDDGTEREFKMHLIGSSDLTDTNEESGIGLIYEYSQSRSLVEASTPDAPPNASASIYAKLLGTDEMTGMMVDNVEADNDSAPYATANYPGGDSNADAAVTVRLLSCNATQSSAQVPGFIAPCGLLKLSLNEIQLTRTGGNPPTGLSTYESVSSPSVAILLTLASGPYRGVLAAPMGQ